MNRLQRNSIPLAPADLWDKETQIQPFYRLSFERSVSHASRGHCLVELFLKNNGFIAASFPFLCLTNLGLNLLPAAGWVKDEPVMIRKMMRFSPGHISASVLESGGAVHCCTVALRYKTAFGGCLEFEAGSEHLLINFPNLNLTCAVGAGNYPSKRLLLQVPATALRDVLNDYVSPQPVMCSNEVVQGNTESSPAS